MNKVLQSCMIALAATTLFSACQKDKEHLVDLTAVIVDQPVSNAKVYIDDVYGCWQHGDAVKIKSGSNGTADYGLLVSGSEESATRATIPDVTEGAPYTAGYPAANATITGNGTLTIDVPASQSYAEASIYSGAATAKQRIVCPMAAYSPDGSDLKFYNVAAMLAVTVTNSESSDLSLYAVEVESDRSPLAGTASVSVDANGASITGASGTSQSVTLTFSSPVTLTASTGEKTLYIPILPIDEGQKSTLTVHVKATKSDGTKKYTFHGVSANAISIEANQIGHVPITLDIDDPETAVNDYFWGQGTEECPYLIENQTDLENLRTVTNAGTSGYIGNTVYYKQIADIELSSWSTGIGNTTSNRFSAHYNGGGRSITNMNNKCCLFSYAGGGSIKNLTVDGSVTKGGDTPENIGGIVANVYGSAETIDNCCSSVDITLRYAGTTTSGIGYSNYGIGGIVGMANANATISNCRNEGTITHDPSKYGYVTLRIGGILGYNYSNGTSISYCINDDALVSQNSSGFGNGAWGGICGYSKASLSIDNCENNAGIKINYNGSTASCFGGILGELDQANASVTIDHCTNNGRISVPNASNSMRIGGIFASSTKSTKITITNCTNTAQLTTVTIKGNTTTVGGIVAYMYAGELEISDCTNGLKNNDSTLTGYNVAGICCSTAVAVTAQRVVNKMSISCSTNSGGILAKATGSTNKSTWSQCTNYGNISANSGYVGGIAGSCVQISSFEICLNKGAISGTSRMGGIIGNAGSAAKTLNECLNDGILTLSGTITDQSTAGLMGYCEANSVTIRNCGNNKTITGTKNAIGGMVGYYRPTGNSTPTIRNSYSNGDITAGTSTNQYGAGIVGCINRNSSGTLNVQLTNCYFNGVATGKYSGNMTCKYGNNSYNGSTITNCYALTGTTASNGTNTSLIFDASKNRLSGEGTYWSGTTTLQNALNDWVTAQGESSGYDSWIVKNGIVTLNVTFYEVADS